MIDLRAYGFVTPLSRVAASPEEAARLAESIGFPVALKVVAPGILHKTDVGGVALNLGDSDAVQRAYLEIERKVGERAPRAAISGMLVEEMVTTGVEVIIGLINDPQFGPALMLGLGGILTEVLDDVSFRLLPVDRRDALEMIDELKGAALLDGYRGAPAVSREMLTDLLLWASHLGTDLGESLEAVDLNPIAVWGEEHRVLDSKVLLRENSVRLGDEPPNIEFLDGFFAARSVALIGASAVPGKVGNAVLESLAKHSYDGTVYAINPSRSEVMGVPAWPTIAAVPDRIDLVVVTVGLSAVPGILQECAAREIHNLVLISGGGKELGAESKALEEEIGRLARELRIRIVGPNCIGVFDGVTRLDTFFQVQERMVRPKAGPIAILSQSGTVAAAVLEAIEPAGVSKLASYGNRVDVDEADLLAYLAHDGETHVIAIYVEGLADGRKFVRAASQLRDKPVVVFKGGHSQRAARASLSHTGFFGGSYGVARGAFQQAGMIVVDSIEELSAASLALALQPVARGGRIAMISNGAGTMVQAMDLLPAHHLTIPMLAEPTLTRLRAAYPPYYLCQNPIDVTGSATSADYEAGVEALFDDPEVDIVMPWFVFQDTPLGEDIVERLGSLSRSRVKPILCGAMGGPYTERMSRALMATGVPVFRTVREWVTAAGALAKFGRRSGTNSV